MNEEQFGKLAANAGCWAAIGGAYVTWGMGTALFATAVYLFLVGVGHQMDEEDE